LPAHGQKAIGAAFAAGALSGQQRSIRPSGHCVGETVTVTGWIFTYTGMGTRAISISDDAYERLSLLRGPSNMSFSEVILKYTPQKKRLSEILKELGPNPALADSVEEASREMRKASMREADFDADA
jgi:predicted CopG family antitoxin